MAQHKIITSKPKKEWRSFEDAFREILDAHKEVFGLESVYPSSRKVPSKAGHVYDVEVLACMRGDHEVAIFECKRKSRNLEPKDAGELTYRIEATGAGKGYFVTRLDKGLSAGANKITNYARIGHIQLSEDASPHEYVMKYLNNFFVGNMLLLHESWSIEHRNS